MKNSKSHDTLSNMAIWNFLLSTCSILYQAISISLFVYQLYLANFIDYLLFQFNWQ